MMTFDAPGEYYAPDLFEDGMDYFFDPDIYTETAPDPYDGVRIERPEDDVAEQRILGVLDRARNVEQEAGMAWYQKAHDMCVDWHNIYGPELTREHIAGIVAALSPRQAWDLNVRRAETLLKTGQVKGLGFVVKDAVAIYSGEHPNEVLYDPTRSNQKVRSFYENIVDPTNPNPVTIDTHMVALLTNNARILQIENRIRTTDYRWAAERFRTVAKDLDLIPNQVQAITWMTWRRMQGINDRALSGQLQIEFLDESAA